MRAARLHSAAVAELELELGGGVRDIPAVEWNALVGDGSPFLEWEWLASLEEAGCVGPETGWAPRPLLLREAGRLVAACPLYVKGHSEGEFVFDWGWADAAERAGIAYYPKLLVGVPFTPVTGARLLTAPGEDRPLRVRQLAAALAELCHGNGLSGAHVNFCRERRARSARRGRLPPAPRLPVPLEERGLRALRGLARRAPQQAPQPGAARARELAEQDVRDRASRGRSDPRRVDPAHVRDLPVHDPRAIPGAGST